MPIANIVTIKACYLGSVSAEHGLGVQKRDALRYSKKPAVVDQMRRIKHLFDPNGIMNPNKMLPMK